jgi:hypothetical protein
VLSDRVYLLVHPRSPELKALTVVFSAEISSLSRFIGRSGTTAPGPHRRAS